jgi:hypothetical protein
VEELRPGLWSWTAPHPDWTPADGGPEGWERNVRSYAYDAGALLVLFDPISPPTAVGELAASTQVAVVLTVPWHRRSTDECVERFGASVHEAGGELPRGVEPRTGSYDEEAVLWIPEHGALVSGDAVLGVPGGLWVQPDAWLPEGLTPQGLRERLSALLDLPVELVLPTHGDPVTEGAREALERALAAS